MSTVHAAAELVAQISSGIDGQSCCACVFIDLKKAFDTVDHEILVENLMFSAYVVLRISGCKIT